VKHAFGKFSRTTSRRCGERRASGHLVREKARRSVRLRGMSETIGIDPRYGFVPRSGFRVTILERSLALIRIVGSSRWRGRRARPGGYLAAKTRAARAQLDRQRAGRGGPNALLDTPAQGCRAHAHCSGLVPTSGSPRTRLERAPATPSPRDESAFRPKTGAPFSLGREPAIATWSNSDQFLGRLSVAQQLSARRTTSPIGTLSLLGGVPASA